MAAEPKAIFRFFSKSTCGHCKHFKGEIDGKIDPNSGWETLSSDPELLAVPIKFVVYLFGPGKDSQTGKAVNYVLDEVSSARLSANGGGVPYLELYSPDEKSGFFKVDLNAVIKGWDAEQCVPQLKAWILETIRKPEFNKPKAASQPAPAVQRAPSQAPSRMPAPQRPASQPVTQNLPNQTQESLISKARAQAQSQASLPAQPAAVIQAVPGQPPQERVAPSTFGMGAREVKPPIPTPEIKKAPRFLPSNYDN